MKNFVYMGRLDFLKPIRINQALCGEFIHEIQLDQEVQILQKLELVVKLPKFAIYMIQDFNVSSSGILNIQKARILKVLDVS